MARDLTTRFVGYAPDERDRENPPELVYTTHEPTRRHPDRYFVEVAGNNPWVTLGIDVVITALAIYVIGGAHFHLW